MIQALLLLLVAAAPPPVETFSAARLKAKAAANCDNRRAKDVPRDVLDFLFKLELQVGVPPVARGLLAAAACNESGYRVKPRTGGIGERGMFQFTGGHRKRIRKHGGKGKDPRLDYQASARYYLAHTMKQLERVRRHCKGRGVYKTRLEYVWASANATAIRYPLCAKGARRLDGRCSKWIPRCARRGRGSETQHWRRLRGWKRAKVTDA